MTGEHKNLEVLLKDGAGRFGAALDKVRVDGFFMYMEMLKEWNKAFNLTAIEDDNDIVIKHFIDSLSILPYLDEGCGRVIDVGSGAGFPAIPLKIVRDSLEVVLLDSLEKRVGFLKAVVEALGLKNTSVFHGRAEDYGRMTGFRESFDTAVARAVAGLPVLLEYCLPFVRCGGTLIAMKGSSLEEVENSGKALDVMGGRIERIESMTLPFTDISRNIIIIRKFRQTPTNYPRKAGRPSKDPLI